MKHPVPSPDVVPACFAFEHDARSAACRRCEVREQCVPTTERWRREQTLARAVAELEQSLAVADTIGQEPIEQTYDRIHREVFGRPSRRRDSERNRAAFSAVLAHCLREDYDVATYIAGGMWAMRPWVDNNPRIGFQPQHLLGEKAERRYHAYRGQQQRRYRRQRIDAAKTSTTGAGELRRQLYLGEFAVAEVYVTSRVAGERHTWEDAQLEVRETIPALWSAAYAPTKHPDQYAKLALAFGAYGVNKELLLARLRAARDIANAYRPGLADQIGFRAFRWEALADLLARMFPVQDRPNLDLSDVPGAQWGV